MKLNYTKILLFSVPLNILVTSSYEYSKTKAYNTHHTPICTSRMLSECDINTSIYDNDEDMKSVKENFDRQTSQRFEEYEERMITQRQKYKEKRDKNIQEIIEKDKMEKSLGEKVEKVCLKCGCGLGGVAASVGIFGTVAVKELTKTATAAAVAAAQEAVKDGAMAATIKAAGAEAFKSAVIAGLEELDISTLNGQTLVSYFATMDYTNAINIARVINNEYEPSSCIFVSSGTRSAPVAREPFCSWVMGNFVAAKDSPGKVSSTYESIKTGVENIVTDAKTVAETAVKKATDEAIQRSIGVVDAKYAICQTAIIASVVALLIIVLVMIIIYLVLRYRRKKKMKKKAHYTKLLNE